MPSTIGKKVFRGAAIVSSFTLLVKVMGFVQKIVMADRFGTGGEADAYTYAFSSIVFTFCIIPHKLLAPFLPLFAEKRSRKGDRDAWRFAASVAVLVILVMATAVALGIAGASHIVRLTSSFQSRETTELAVTLLRIMLPSAFFMGLFWLLSLIMHSYKRFAFPALGEAANKVLVIFLMIALYRSLGIKGLAIGVMVGAAAAMSLQLVGLRKHLRPALLRPDPGDPSLGKLGRLMLPILLGIVTSQVARTVLDFWFVSRMGGGYTSSLGYAKSLADALTLLVPFAVGTVIYPFFADLSAEGDKVKMTDTLMGSLRVMAFLFIPLSVGLVVLRTPVLQLIYQRGAFEMSSVRLTSGPLLFYSLGLTAFALEILLMRFYLSMKDTLTPVLVGIFCVVLHVAIVLSSRHVLLHSAIALAAACSKSVKVAVLFALLRHKIPRLQIRQNTVFLLKTLLAAAAMGLIVFVVDRTLGTALAVPQGSRAVVAAARLAARLGLSVLAGTVVFAAAALVLKSEEARMLVGHLRRRSA